jgi:hypothetical protein
VDETLQSLDKVLEGDGRMAIEGTEDHPWSAKCD